MNPSAATPKPNDGKIHAIPPVTKPSMAMTFAQHLEELRQRLIFCFVTLVSTTALAFYLSKPMVIALQRLTPKDTIFVQLSPGEVFLSSFKLATFAGLGLSLPIILYHVFRFITPGLENKEKRFVLPLMMLGLLLFCSGVYFGYAVILPLMLTFLLDFGQTLAQNQLSIANFLNFCMGFLFASGLIFQIPIVLLLMSFIGLVKSSQLFAQWKWAIIISFILGAVITPSADPFSQVVMSACLVGLYGFSILLLKIFRR